MMGAMSDIALRTKFRFRSDPLLEVEAIVSSTQSLLWFPGSGARVRVPGLVGRTRKEVGKLLRDRAIEAGQFCVTFTGDEPTIRGV
jgi:hypothetical protein